jgi:hypothetical protein
VKSASSKTCLPCLIGGSAVLVLMAAGLYWIASSLYNLFA